MTEIYLVGVGEHYEFSVDNVFSNKDKAEKYARLINNRNESDEARVMPYEVIDDVKYDTCNWLKINTSKVLDKDDYKFVMEIVEVIDSEDDLDNYENAFNLNDSRISTQGYVTEGYFMGGRKNQVISITLRRKLPSNFNAQEIEKKYKKITQEIISTIEQNPTDDKGIGRLEYELGGM